MNPQIEIAREIAIKAHKGQFRRDGVTPYITHPEAVANAVSDAAKPAAWLHDVLEDCPPLDAISLFESGVDVATIAAVRSLTKYEGEDYFAYIENIKKDPIAREVKIADIEHNLASNPKPENIAKYNRALGILKAKQG